MQAAKAAGSSRSTGTPLRWQLLVGLKQVLSFAHRHLRRQDKLGRSRPSFQLRALQCATLRRCSQCALPKLLLRSQFLQKCFESWYGAA